MAINITFFSFSKKMNSTSQPSGGLVTSCDLKRGTDVLNPQIIINRRDMSNYNYAYIPAFSRYYWINNWSVDGGLWYGALSVDALASWKAEIGSTDAYILRSSAEWDGTVSDGFYPATAEHTYNRVVADNPYATSLSSGTYVIGITGAGSSGIGATTYYALTNSQMRTLVNHMFSSSDWIDDGQDSDNLMTVKQVDPDTGEEITYNYNVGKINKVGRNLTRALYDPIKYIASCVWIPGGVGTGGSESVKIGFWDSGISGTLLSANARWNTTFAIVLPKHPQADARGEYLNLSPFSRYRVYIPPFGVIPLDATKLQGVVAINVSIVIDAITGNGILNVYAGSDLIAHAEARVGISCSLAQQDSNYIGAATSAISAITSAAMGNIVGGLSAIGNAVNSMLPDLAVMGGSGGMGALIPSPALYADFQTIVDEDINDNGRPLCKIRTIGDIPGYIVCNGHVEAPATAGELAEINNYLTGGFFYE